MLLWLIARLVFWVGVMVVIVVGASVVIAGPPFFAGRYLWHRYR